jgi:hypothetical protein
VFLELMRRYYQVCASLVDKTTVEREIGSLELVGDHWPGTVIVLEEPFIAGRSGVRVVSLRDFPNGAEWTARPRCLQARSVPPLVFGNGRSWQAGERPEIVLRPP